MNLYRDLELTPTTLGAIVDAKNTTLDALTGGPCPGPCCDGTGDGFCQEELVAEDCDNSEQ